MRKPVLIVLLLITGLGACMKNNTSTCDPAPVTTQANPTEVSALKGILSGSGINATEDPRGFFYIFDTLGTGAKPNTCNMVRVDYRAKLMDGTQVDSGMNAIYQVKQFIVGWQEALPLMPVGSYITLYLPPSLAYGNQQAGSIPPNSNLEFEIKLESIPQ